MYHETIVKLKHEAPRKELVTGHLFVCFLLSRELTPCEKVHGRGLHAAHRSLSVDQSVKIEGGYNFNVVHHLARWAGRTSQAGRPAEHNAAAYKASREDFCTSSPRGGESSPPQDKKAFPVLQEAERQLLCRGQYLVVVVESKLIKMATSRT